jgi:iron(III) transport system permease protein
MPILGLGYALVLPNSSGDTLSHLLNYVLGDYVLTSFILILGVGIGIFILGVGNAWLIANYQFPGKSIFEWALILPLAVPTYVMAYLFVDLLQFSGPIQSFIRDITGVHSLSLFDPRSLFGAIWTFSFCLFPYVYLTVRTSFLDRSARLIEVAETLGYGQFEAFYRLVLPMARPAIFTGIALALMEVLADYGAVSYFGLQTFATGIFKSWLGLGDRVAAVQLSLILLFFVLIIFYWEQSNRARLRFVNQNSLSRAVIPKRLRGKKALFAFCFCGITLLFGFILPMLILFKLFLLEGFEIDPRFFSWLKNSVQLGVITAFVATALAIFLAYSARISNSKWLITLNRFISVGYALPGAVLAVGILSLLGIFEAGWLLSTTTWILIYAYVIRFLSSGLQNIELGLGRITPAMDSSAALLGAGALETARRVHLPLLSRSILTAALFVLVDVMKELPATLLLRPFNFDTLAVATYQLAADERLVELALPAFSIVLVGLIPVIFLSRAISKQRPY